jgi:ankyrin repeat protein
MFHLLEGADVNGKKATGHFPLAGAAYYGHAQAVKYLLEHGAKIDLLTALNWSPLYIAVWRQHLDVAEVLLSAGASTKSHTLYSEYGPSLEGFTALHAAAHTGNSKMVRLLLKHGADVGKKAGGRLPEDVASDEGHKAVARLLRAKRRARP